MITKSKSKAWTEYSSKVDEVLGRMYDTNYQGQEVTIDSPECVDAILRLSNLSIKMGIIDFFPLTEHYAKLLVADELQSRKELKQQRRH
jgi:hypothetical protein